MQFLIEVGEPAKPFWDLIPVIVGAVIGAAAGAVPSYLLANKSARELEKRDKNEQLRLNRTAARSAAFKMQRIVNGLAIINSQLDEMLYIVEHDGIPAEELWRALIPIGGIAPEVVRFDMAEIALVYDAKEPLLVNEMILVADRYHAA